MLLTLGLTLILGGAYLRSTFSLPPSGTTPPPFTDLSAAPLAPNSYAPTYPYTRSDRALIIAFPAAVALHAALALLHTPPALARVGAHVAAYASLVVALGVLFAGLAMWGAVS
jgi:hypothetical protein